MTAKAYGRHNLVVLTCGHIQFWDEPGSEPPAQLANEALSAFCETCKKEVAVQEIRRDFQGSN